MRPPIIRHPYRFVAALEGLVLVVYLAAGTVAQVVRLPGLWLYAAANFACCEAPGQRLRQGSRHPQDRDHVKGFAQPLLRRSQPYSGPLERSRQVVVAELYGPIGNPLHFVARVLGHGRSMARRGPVVLHAAGKDADGLLGSLRRPHHTDCSPRYAPFPTLPSRERTRVSRRTKVGQIR